MSYKLNFDIGDHVIVLDRRGNHDARGVIVARTQDWKGPRYDVQPYGTLSLAERMPDVAEARIRHMGISLVKACSN